MKKIIIPIFAIISFLTFNSNAFAYEGIDVSIYQGDIDFKQVANDKIEVVYIRSSAGNSYIDPKFERNYQGAKENNLKIGFYHYVTARSIEQAREQAIFFASVIKDKEIDCYLAMDFEVFTGLTKEETNRISEAFLETLERVTKKKAIVYSDASNAANTFDSRIYQKYPLWIAQYGVDKPELYTWKEWAGWQYTDRGRIAGIRGNVDRDIFKDAIFLDDNKPIKNLDLNDKEKTKKIHYRIKKGDTLSHIAKKYHVKVNDLKKWNNIININLIFPDQVLDIIVDYQISITTTGENNIYKIKKGDNLTKIAHQYNVTISNLVTWNNIKNPNLIYPGELLKINQVNNDHVIEYIVNEEDTIDKITTNFNVSKYELQKINSNLNKVKKGDIIYIPETYLY